MSNKFTNHQEFVSVHTANNIWWLITDLLFHWHSLGFYLNKIPTEINSNIETHSWKYDKTFI